MPCQNGGEAKVQRATMMLMSGASACLSATKLVPHQTHIHGSRKGDSPVLQQTRQAFVQYHGPQKFGAVKEWAMLSGTQHVAANRDEEE